MPLVCFFERGPPPWISEGIERFELKSEHILAGWEIDDVRIEESVPADMDLAAEDHDETAVELSDDAGAVDQQTGRVISFGNTSARSQGAIYLLPGDGQPPAGSRLGFSWQRGGIIAAPWTCLAERS